MIKFYKILFLSLVLLAIAQVGLAHNVDLQANLPAGKPITFTEVNNIIETIAQFLVVMGVVIAVIMIVWSGITYMAAGSNTTAVGNAQARLKNGIIGAAVVLGVGVIIQTIAGIVTRDFFCRVQLLGVCIIN